MMIFGWMQQKKPGLGEISGYDNYKYLTHSEKSEYI